jgi:FKBP-type peptidyl-prolyl cis-trans isomerase SlyD
MPTQDQAQYVKAHPGEKITQSSRAHPYQPSQTFPSMTAKGEIAVEIAPNHVAFFHYTLTDAEGSKLDSSEGESPLSYIHGHRNIIPGLERALTGKQAGDSFKITLDPEEAYGAYDDSLVQTVPRQAFEIEEDLEVGMQFQAQFKDGERIISVKAIRDDEVIVDGNHPLAGETLTFDVEVTDVREATEEELSHGHVHGSGGHGH